MPPPKQGQAAQNPVEEGFIRVQNAKGQQLDIDANRYTQLANSPNWKAGGYQVVGTGPRVNLTTLQQGTQQTLGATIQPPGGTELKLTPEEQQQREQQRADVAAEAQAPGLGLLGMMGGFSPGAAMERPELLVPPAVGMVTGPLLGRTSPLWQRALGSTLGGAAGYYGTGKVMGHDPGVGESLWQGVTAGALPEAAGEAMAPLLTGFKGKTTLTPEALREVLKREGRIPASIGQLADRSPLMRLFQTGLERNAAAHSIAEMKRSMGKDAAEQRLIEILRDAAPELGPVTEKDIVQEAGGIYQGHSMPSVFPPTAGRFTPPPPTPAAPRGPLSGVTTAGFMLDAVHLNAVNDMFPGRSWEQLTEAEKNKVMERVNKSVAVFGPKFADKPLGLGDLPSGPQPPGLSFEEVEGIRNGIIKQFFGDQPYTQLTDFQKRYIDELTNIQVSQLPPPTPTNPPLPGTPNVTDFLNQQAGRIYQGRDPVDAAHDMELLEMVLTGKAGEGATIESVLADPSVHNPVKQALRQWQEQQGRIGLAPGPVPPEVRQEIQNEVTEQLFPGQRYPELTPYDKATVDGMVNTRTQSMAQQSAAGAGAPPGPLPTTPGSTPTPPQAGMAITGNYMFTDPITGDTMALEDRLGPPTKEAVQQKILAKRREFLANYQRDPEGSLAKLARRPAPSEILELRRSVAKGDIAPYNKPSAMTKSGRHIQQYLHGPAADILRHGMEMLDFDLKAFTSDLQVPIVEMKVAVQERWGEVQHLAQEYAQTGKPLPPEIKILKDIMDMPGEIPFPDALKLRTRWYDMTWEPGIFGSEGKKFGRHWANQLSAAMDRTVEPNPMAREAWSRFRGTWREGRGGFEHNAVVKAIEGNPAEVARAIGDKPDNVRALRHIIHDLPQELPFDAVVRNRAKQTWRRLQASYLEDLYQRGGIFKLHETLSSLERKGVLEQLFTDPEGKALLQRTRDLASVMDRMASLYHPHGGTLKNLLGGWGSKAMAQIMYSKPAATLFLKGLNGYLDEFSRMELGAWARPAAEGGLLAKSRLAAAYPLQRAQWLSGKVAGAGERISPKMASYIADMIRAYELVSTTTPTSQYGPGYDAPPPPPLSPYQAPEEQPNAAP